jgi:hypothetical protein
VKTIPEQFLISLNNSPFFMNLDEFTFLKSIESVHGLFPVLVLVSTVLGRRYAVQSSGVFWAPYRTAFRHCRAQFHRNGECLLADMK